MADQSHCHEARTGYSTQPLNVYPQWLPSDLGEGPASTGASSTTPHQGRWPPNTTRVVPFVPCQTPRNPEDQLPSITDPRDLYLAEEALPELEPQAQQNELDDLAFAIGTVPSDQLPHYVLPGLIFGSDFEWDFNPGSDLAASIWSQMPAHSWLDTSEGWTTMLRPESPNPTEGDLSVDSHALHYIPRTPSVQSLNVNEYVEKNGRKYHRYHEGKYLLPNDEQEQDRLDLQHAAVTMLFHGELKLCPLESPKRVLDLATGTGIWAIQFAERYPNATVIGTDLSPMQPDAKPGNCRFWVEDSEDPWHFDVPFDYIHARFVCSCYNNPSGVIQQAYDNLEPGGWIEFQDGDPIPHCDDSTLDGTAFLRIFQLFDETAQRLWGRDCRVAERYKQFMIDVGFEDVTERKFKLPGNSWPKDRYAKQIGLYHAANMRDAVDGITKAALTRGLGMSEEERMSMAEQARFDVTNPAVHWYHKIYVVYGRKPYAPSLVPATTSTLTGVGTFC